MFAKAAAAKANSLEPSTSGAASSSAGPLPDEGVDEDVGADEDARFTALTYPRYSIIKLE